MPSAQPHPHLLALDSDPFHHHRRASNSTPVPTSARASGAQPDPTRWCPTQPCTVLPAWPCSLSTSAPPTGPALPWPRWRPMSLLPLDVHRPCSLSEPAIRAASRCPSWPINTDGACAPHRRDLSTLLVPVSSPLLLRASMMTSASSPPALLTPMPPPCNTPNVK
jgi:hypothetical protein